MLRALLAVGILSMLVGCVRTAVAIAMDRQVKNAIDAGEGDPFVRSLRQKVAADPENAAARFELAAHYTKQGAPELAMEHYRIAVDRQPDSEFAVRKLAEALAGNGQELESIALLVRYCDSHAQASSELLESVALAQDESGGNNLGFNFLRQKKYEDAAHEFQAALQLNPKSETARNNLGFALARLDQKEALLHWASLSGPAAAHNNLAAALIEDGKLPEARREIQAALDFDRHNAAAIQNLQMVSELDGGSASFTLSSKKAGRRKGWTQALTGLFRGASGKHPQNGTGGECFVASGGSQGRFLCASERTAAEMASKSAK